ncbi:hypothetical protein HanPSC8_Chr14g0597011 [Helianthus annuus]|nr:hypothetical protein HanPSC8_Chr14g0597011 [Helianthus annuus]
MSLSIEEDKKITEEMIQDYLLLSTKSTMEFINMGEENKKGEKSEKKTSAESDTRLME